MSKENLTSNFDSYKQKPVAHSRSCPTSNAPNQRTRILEALRSAGPRGCSNLELSRVGGLRFGGRVFELRETGYEIKVARGDSEGSFTYVLVSEPQSLSSGNTKPTLNFTERRRREEDEALPLFAGGAA